MSRQVTVSDFSYVSGVDPGDGLQYYAYDATVSERYDVYVDADVPNPQYFLFRMASPDWLVSDSVSIVDLPGGTFETGAGDDTLSNGGRVRFFSGAGDDRINAASSRVDPGHISSLEAYGGSGNDTINGGDEADKLYGDTADSFTGNPVIASVTLAPYDTSGDGDDTINGYGGNDTIEGNGGDDQLSGDDGSDTIDGGAGDDFLFGGPRGRGYLDVLTGGAGSDAFMLSYRDDGAGSGSSFWSGYFASSAQDFADTTVGDVVQNILDETTEEIASGIIGASLGATGGELAGAFVNLVESLLASGTPATVNQDAMVVTDFDPRRDVLMLPLQKTVTESLTATVVTALQVPGGNGDAKALEFSAGGKVYAYVELSSDFLSAMGIAANSDAASQVLNNVVNLSSALESVNGTVGFTNLVSSTISNALPGGGFQAQKASLPLDSAVSVFGAVGGLVIANGESQTFGHVLAGTDYTDVLSTNPELIGFSQLTLATTAAYIHGFGGSDVIYGTSSADTLFGDDGNDFVYGFVSTTNGDGGVDPESVSGGAGDDVLYGGGSAGVFDGGSGSDTFGVVYLPLLGPAKQLEVDLTAGYAAERAAPADTKAPVGSTAPFPGTGLNKVPNSYVLTSIENAIGGPLNDWIKAANGSRIEGGFGADYLDANAGNVTLSYESSAAGVRVQVYKYHVESAGGDAEGDVVGTSSAPSSQSVNALIGSPNDDILGAFNGLGSLGTISMEGGAGNDVFQLLGVSAGDAIYVIGDFTSSATEHDLIDVRGLGVTSFDQFFDLGLGRYSIWKGLPFRDAPPIAFVLLGGPTEQLDASDFIFADAAAGTAYDDAYIVRQGQTLVAGPTAGVLINDEGFATASLVRDADHGTVQLAADGNFRYTPDAGYSGIDIFAYQAAADGTTPADGRALVYVFPTLGRTIDLLAFTPEQQIAATYAAFLGRAADAAGHAYWLAELEAGPATTALATIARSFAISSEARTLYPLLMDPRGASDAAIGTLVDTIYGNLFNRSADAGGLAYWTARTKQAIAAGADVGNVMLDIISGTAVGPDAQTLLGKVAVGLEFVQQQALLLTQWEGAMDVQAATALLQGVGDDPQTVLLGIKQADQLVANHL